MLGQAFAPITISMLPAAALALCFLVAVIVMLSDRPPASGTASARASTASRIGIVIQSLGFAAAGIGVRQLQLRLDADAFVRSALVVALFASFILLFCAARAALGANWSLVARMREDHGLVTSGPFAQARHPIYAGLFLLFLAIVIALGTWTHMIFALPLFVIGSAIRVAEEERLLKAQFGTAYDAYAARVKRFVPGVI